MRSRVLGACNLSLFLSLQLLAATSAHAQGPQPPTPPKAQPPVSSVAHNVITWFHHVTGTGAHRHRIVSSPPLPLTAAGATHKDASGTTGRSS